MEIKNHLLQTLGITNDFIITKKDNENIQKETTKLVATDVDEASQIIKESSQYNLKNINIDIAKKVWVRYNKNW